jgi:hypothetical protein
VKIENIELADYTKSGKRTICQPDNKEYPDLRLKFYARDEIFCN